MYDNGGIESLLFTSDNPKGHKDYGTTDGGTIKLLGLWTVKSNDILRKQIAWLLINVYLPLFLQFS